VIDFDIHEFLIQEGFGHPVSLSAATTALQEAGLSHPGRQRIAGGKLEKARLELRARLIVTCASRSCVEAAGAFEGRRLVPAQPGSACHVCGGSSNAYAVERMLRAAMGAGLRRLVVVGGSPSTRRELQSLVSGRLSLRLIDGTARRSAGQARDDLAWGDLVIVWGNTQLAHRVSLLYTRRSGVHTPVITVARRGVAGLAEGLIRHVVERERSRTRARLQAHQLTAVA